MLDIYWNRRAALGQPRAPLHKSLLKKLSQKLIWFTLLSLSMISSIERSSADRSELGLSLGSKHLSPSDEGERRGPLGLHQELGALEVMSQLGISRDWSLGLSLGLGRAWPSERSSASLINPDCSEELDCYKLRYLTEVLDLDLGLSALYIPLDLVSPVVMTTGALWGRWRTEAYELIADGSEQRVSRSLGGARWLGHSLSLGGGVYWRFLSRWSTMFTLSVEHKQELGTSGLPTLENLSFGVSLWLTYHRYVRLF